MSFFGFQGGTGAEVKTVDASQTGIPVREKNEKNALSLPKLSSLRESSAVAFKSVMPALMNVLWLVLKLFTQFSHSTGRANL